MKRLWIMLRHILKKIRIFLFSELGLKGGNFWKIVNSITTLRQSFLIPRPFSFFVLFSPSHTHTHSLYLSIYLPIHLFICLSLCFHLCSCHCLCPFVSVSLSLFCSCPSVLISLSFLYPSDLVSVCPCLSVSASFSLSFSVSFSVSLPLDGFSSRW